MKDWNADENAGDAEDRCPLHRAACGRIRAVATTRSRRVVASGPAPIRAAVAHKRELKLSYTEQNVNI